MKTAPQLRLRNEWEGRTQTRSKRNNSCRFQRNRCGFLPLITVWRRFESCRARRSSLAAQATAQQAILFRVRSISPIALMCWIQGGVDYHAAAHELLADNGIKERCCSV